MISEEEFVRYAELVRNVCTKMTDVPSEFEKAVALAFFYILMKTGVILWCWKSAWAVVMMQPM